MINFIKDTKNQIETMIHHALEQAYTTGQLKKVDLPHFIVEIPADTTHGDFATNVAMVSARSFQLPPLKIAQIIVEHLSFTHTFFKNATTAGPGFINFTLCNTWFAQVLQGILHHGVDYGRSNFGAGEKVMVEFVSANPTGPMHMGNARGGSIGDCLASVLSMAGFDVTREFLINDAGNQINKLANSLDARYEQLFKGEYAVQFPEDGYQGEDIKERARELEEEFSDTLLNLCEEERKEKMIAFILPKNIAKLKA
ncbi:MAG: arginine--tRNA ligase, partial [Oscillospiraceae bacterium]